MIVVTTPTGNIGRHVVRHLLEANEALRLIVRDPSKLTAEVRDRVELVQGSLDDVAVVDRAFQGADAVFWLCPPAPSATPAAATVDFSRPGADAIRRHGVAHIVAVTTLGRDTPWQDRAGNATGSIRMVDLMRKTGAAVRGLALPAFMDNALRQVDAIRQGRMLGPIHPDKKLPHTATRDTGAAAAALLIDRSWAGHEDIPVLGPEELSYGDLANIVSEVIYAKLVQKVGNRHHWEDWANDIAKIARTHIDRITGIIENLANTTEREAFDAFAHELRDDLNASITDVEIIEMLAQHLITKPVFDALFKDYMRTISARNCRAFRV